MRLVLVLAVSVAACAPAATVTVGPDHPASPDAPTAGTPVAFSALAPTPAPRLPAALRPATAAATGTDHAAMGHAGPRPSGEAAAAPSAADHAAMGHTTPMSADRPAAPTAPASAQGMAASETSPMTEALDAYFALHDALASDNVDAARAHGAHFARAFGALAEAPPAGDPHFWHTRSVDVAAVRAAAADLPDAADLAAARVAFGTLSVPFARLVEAAGLPEGVAVERFRCGMAQGVPDGGIWLQRPGPTRNPYFGAAMLTCGSRTGTLSSSTPTGAAADTRARN